MTTQDMMPAYPPMPHDADSTKTVALIAGDAISIEIADIALNESLQGHAVLALPYGYHRLQQSEPRLTEEERDRLGTLLFRLIGMADESLVLNIGDRVTAQMGIYIRYARFLEQPIRFLEEHTCCTMCPCQPVPNASETRMVLGGPSERPTLFQKWNGERTAIYIGQTAPTSLGEIGPFHGIVPQGLTQGMPLCSDGTCLQQATVKLKVLDTSVSPEPVEVELCARHAKLYAARQAEGGEWQS